MDFGKELLPGVQHVSLRRFQDDRGTFVKTYSRQLFDANGAPFDLREEFYSFSRKDRRMIMSRSSTAPPVRCWTSSSTCAAARARAPWRASSCVATNPRCS